MSSNPWNRPPYYIETESRRHNVAGPLFSLLILVVLTLAAVQSCADIPETLPPAYYREVKDRADGYVLDYRGEPQSCELACHGGR